MYIFSEIKVENIRNRDKKCSKKYLHSLLCIFVKTRIAKCWRQITNIKQKDKNSTILVPSNVI